MSVAQLIRDTVVREVDSLERMVAAWEVAQLVGVASSTVLRWAEQGKIRSYRPKGSIRPVRFMLSEVMDDLRGGDDDDDDDLDAA